MDSGFRRNEGMCVTGVGGVMGGLDSSAALGMTGGDFGMTGGVVLGLTWGWHSE